MKNTFRQVLRFLGKTCNICRNNTESKIMDSKDGKKLPGILVEAMREYHTNVTQHGNLTIPPPPYAPPEVRSLYFRDQTVSLDGYKFIGCRFDKCTLTAVTTQFELDHCIIDGSCTFLMGEDLMRVMRLYNRNATWIKDYPSWGPDQNADGTVSILGWRP